MTPWLETFLTRFGEMGHVGLIPFALSVGLLTMLGLPITPFAILGGIVFGLWNGIIGVVVGSTLGAAGGFLCSRYVARERFAAFVHKRPKFALIDQTIQREGWKIVALLRLCPLPFGLCNFAYGLTAISFPHYLIATLVGVLPDEIVFVYLGTAGREWLDNPAALNSSPHVKALFYIGVVAAITAFVFIHRMVNKRLALGTEPVN